MFITRSSNLNVWMKLFCSSSESWTDFQLHQEFWLCAFQFNSLWTLIKYSRFHFGKIDKCAESIWGQLEWGKRLKVKKSNFLFFQFFILRHKRRFNTPPSIDVFCKKKKKKKRDSWIMPSVLHSRSVFYGC